MSSDSYLRDVDRCRTLGLSPEEIFEFDNKKQLDKIYNEKLNQAQETIIYKKNEEQNNDKKITINNWEQEEKYKKLRDRICRNTRKGIIEKNNFRYVRCSNQECKRYLKKGWVIYINEGKNYCMTCKKYDVN